MAKQPETIATKAAIIDSIWCIDAIDITALAALIIVPILPP